MASSTADHQLVLGEGASRMQALNWQLNLCLLAFVNLAGLSVLAQAQSSSAPPAIQSELQIVLDTASSRWTLREGFREGNAALKRLEAYVGTDSAWDSQLVDVLLDKKVSVQAIAASDQNLFELYWKLISKSPSLKDQEDRVELFTKIFEDCGFDARIDSALVFLARQKDVLSLQPKALEKLLQALRALDLLVSLRATRDRPLNPAELSILVKSRSLQDRILTALKD
jgi:hypothetical protein